MITGPEQIFAAAGSDDSSKNWDGVSQHNGKDVKNRETEMDFAEHQRIVVDARKLLCNFSNNRKPEELDAAQLGLWHLSNAYLTNIPGYKVWITKGIHQPASNPHIQLQLTGNFDRRSPYVFHLNLSAGRAIQSSDDPEIEEYFYWEGVQFTVDVSVDGNKVSADWPLNSNRLFKKARRKSVCFSAELEQRINDQNEAIALEEQAALAEAALKAKNAKDKADALKAKKEAEFIESGGPRKLVIDKLLKGMGVVAPSTDLVNKIYTGGGKKIIFKTVNISYSGISTGMVDGKISFVGTKTKIKGNQVSECELKF